MRRAVIASWGIVLSGAFAAPGNAAACLFQLDHCAAFVAFLDTQDTVIERQAFESACGTIAVEQLEREKSGKCTTFPALASADADDGLFVSQRSFAVVGFGVDGQDVRPTEMKLIRQESRAETTSATYCAFLPWKEII